MKNLRQFILLVIISVYGLSSFATEIADSSIRVTYIGSTGYLLETANKKVLVDPTYGDIVQGFGYPYASADVESKLLNAEAPFDNIDLILISHIHLGHFDAVKTYECLKANSGATLITLQTVADSIASVAEDFASVESRIFVPDAGAYNTIDTIFNEVSVNTTKIDNHRGPSDLLQFSFKMDSLHLAFYLDYNKQEDQDHHVKTRDIDFAVLDGALMLDAAKREMFKTDFEVGYSVFTHFTNASAMDTRLEENKDDFPNVGYMPASMDCQLFNFSGGGCQLTQLNSAPVFSDKLEHDTIMVGANFSIDVADLISDADGDAVVLSATLNNGSDIPDWITIDGANKTLSGTAGEAQTVLLQLIITDENGAWTKESKRLVITSTTETKSVDANKNNILLYPSTATDVIHIDISNLKEPISEVTICDISAKVIMSSAVNNAITQLSVVDFTTGMYTVFLKGEEVIYTKRFVKN